MPPAQARRLDDWRAWRLEFGKFRQRHDLRLNNRFDLSDMGHSVTDFRGASFTAKDWKLEVWLHLLAREIAATPSAPEWLKAAGALWQEQAAVAVNGLMNPDLDSILTTDERVHVLRKLVQKEFSRLQEFGDAVPRDFLNSLCNSTDYSRFNEDTPTESLLKYGRALLKLLDGKMRRHEFA